MKKVSVSALRKRLHLGELLYPGGKKETFLTLNGKRVAIALTRPFAEGAQVKRSEVIEPLRGMGIGKKLYGEILRRAPSGILYSDATLSEEATRLWEGMKKRRPVSESPAYTKIDRPKQRARIFRHSESTKWPEGSLERGHQYRTSLPTKALIKSSMWTDIPAFLDELEKISFMRDVGGYMWNLGRRGVAAVQSGVSGAAQNVGNAASAFLTPQESLKKGWKTTWTPGGKPLHPAWKALMGYNLVTGARDIAKKEDPSGQGQSRIHRAIRLAGDQAGGIIGAPYGFTGGLAASMIGSRIGDIAGSAVDRLRGRRPPQQPLPAQQSPR